MEWYCKFSAVYPLKPNYLSIYPFCSFFLTPPPPSTTFIVRIYIKFCFDSRFNTTIRSPKCLKSYTFCSFCKHLFECIKVAMTLNKKIRRSFLWPQEGAINPKNTFAMNSSFKSGFWTQFWWKDKGANEAVWSDVFAFSGLLFKMSYFLVWRSVTSTKVVTRYSMRMGFRKTRHYSIWYSDKPILEPKQTFHMIK